MVSIGGRLREAARVGAWALERGADALRAAAGGDGAQAGAEAPAPGQAPDPQRSQAPKDLDDITIARKVESVIFRPRGRPKDTVDVNVVDGVVWLRGVARTPGMIRRLEVEARAIPEVKEVQNLLHLPRTPAPTRTDTLASQRRTRRRASAPPRARTEPRSLNADKTIAQGEPLPEEPAKERRGRPASPLGSTEPEAATPEPGTPPPGGDPA